MWPRTRIGIAAAGAALGAIALLMAMVVVSNHAADARTSADGIPNCPAGAGARLLSHHALQCWFDSPHGRWRIVEQYSAHGALIVHVQATTAVDAQAITEEFVVHEGAALPEILVYVNAAPPGQLTVTRRVRWTRQTGFDTLEFAGGTVQ